MKVTLIGASGFVGSAILRELLERGHQVTAVVRHPDRIEVKNKNLIVKSADVFKKHELRETINDQDAVINAFNPGWTNPNLYEDFINGSESIQKAIKETNVKRLIVVGGAGSLYVAPGVQAVDTPEFPAEWKQGATAARDYLNILKKEEVLQWTFVSPAFNLFPGTRTGEFRLGLENPVVNENGESKISVEDLAVAIVNELEKPEHIQRRFTIGY